MLGDSKGDNVIMTRRNLHIVVLAFSLAGFSWLAWNAFDNSGGHATPVCLIKAVTGIPCPSCGTTRAMVSLVQGRIVDSIFENPFGILLAAALALFPCWVVVDSLLGTSGFYRFYGWVERLFASHVWVAAAGAGVVLLNWIWNIAKGL